MNFIKQLKQDRIELIKQLDNVNKAIMEIERYLTLPKFYKDPYVNIGDVFLRIDEMRNDLILDERFKAILKEQEDSDNEN